MPRGGTEDELPLQPGAWQLDAGRSTVGFRVRHLGLSSARGAFERVDATLTIGRRLQDVSVEATVDMASIGTGQRDRDEFLHRTPFFSADRHPDMVFRSTAALPVGGSRYRLDGDLTVNGITRPVSFEVTFDGVGTRRGDDRPSARFHATGEVSRPDYGIEFDVPLGMDRMALGQKVRVELDVQFVGPAT